MSASKRLRDDAGDVPDSQKRMKTSREGDTTPLSQRRSEGEHQTDLTMFEQFPGSHLYRDNINVALDAPPRKPEENARRTATTITIKLPGKAVEAHAQHSPRDTGPVDRQDTAIPEAQSLPSADEDNSAPPFPVAHRHNLRSTKGQKQARGQVDQVEPVYIENTGHEPQKTKKETADPNLPKPAGSRQQRPRNASKQKLFRDSKKILLILTSWVRIAYGAKKLPVKSTRELKRLTSFQSKAMDGAVGEGSQGTLIGDAEKLPDMLVVFIEEQGAGRCGPLAQLSRLGDMMTLQRSISARLERLCMLST